MKQFDSYHKSIFFEFIFILQRAHNARRALHVHSVLPFNWSVRDVLPTNLGRLATSSTHLPHCSSFVHAPGAFGEWCSRLCFYLLFMLMSIAVQNGARSSRRKISTGLTSWHNAESEPFRSCTNLYVFFFFCNCFLMI